jgi:hypothetical protein
MADRLIVRRRDEWARLEALLTAHAGARAERTEEVGWRYREASADLALCSP